MGEESPRHSYDAGRRQLIRFFSKRGLGVQRRRIVRGPGLPPGRRRTRCRDWKQRVWLGVGLYTYTEPKALTDYALARLGSAVDRKLSNSPFVLGSGAEVAPMSTPDYRIAKRMSVNERRCVGWRS